MENNPTISIIIPVYNVEKYLNHCIQSILSQTMQNYELICIDDGSSDSSLEILNELKSHEARMHVVHQDNQGAAAARNAGIELASGEYLAILDSDDFYESTMLEQAFSRAKCTDADVVVFGSDTFYTDTKTFEPYPYSIRHDLLPNKDVFAGTEIETDAFRAFIGWSWDKLFKTSFVMSSGLRFQEIRTSNDMFFVFCSIAKAQRIAVLDEVLVHHRRGVKGLAETREQSWHCFHDALMRIKAQLMEWGLFDHYERDFVNYCLHASLWNLDTLKEPTRASLLEALASKWYEEFGVLNKPKEYFFSQDDYRKLSLVLRAANPKVSIIIPSLNSKKYYRECINSARGQTIDEIEIICVDAGSTDGTRDLITRLMKKDPRIRLIDSMKRSYGHQMNLGLAAAKGKFISILESDDAILPHAIQYYYDLAARHNLDFVKSDTGILVGRGDERKITPRRLHESEAFYDRIWNPSENAYLLRLYNLTQPGLYRLSLIREQAISYHESPGASYQDNGFWYQTFTQASRAMFTHEICYLLRRDNPGSSVKSTGKVYAMCDEYDFIRKKLKERELDQFLPMCAASRFNNYEFTCSRIGDWNRPAFFERYAQDFRKLEKSGELQRAYFSAQQWRIIQEIMAHGRDYYHLGWAERQQSKGLKRKARKSSAANSGRTIPRALKLFRAITSRVGYKDTIQQLSIAKIKDPFIKDYSNFLSELSDKDLAFEVSRAYAQTMGWPPNLDKPETYNDKVQTKKIHDELRAKKAFLASARTARIYVEEQGFSTALPELYGLWPSFDKINFETLPDSFLLRCSHARNFEYQIPSKRNANFDFLEKQFKTWMKGDYALQGPLEMEYQGLERCILAEELLFEPDDEEYVFWCFHGQARYIEYTSTYDKKRQTSFFDRDWKWQPFKYANHYHDAMPTKPASLTEMLNMADKLSAGFDHIRIHLRSANGKVIFERFTFSANGGYCNWSLPEADSIMGRLWNTIR